MSKDATGQVEHYLAEVDAALFESGVPDRAEIVEGLREHIAEATSSDGGRTPTEVMQELGDPQTIAASAAAEMTEGAPVTGRPRRGRPWFSILALVLVFVGALLAGYLVPIVLVLIGLVLLWLSTAWTVREKLWGTLLVPAPGLVLWIILGFASVGQECVTVASGNDEQTTCTGGAGGAGGVIATVLLVGVAVVGAAVTIRLARRALVRE